MQSNSNSNSTVATLDTSTYETTGQQVTRAALFCTDEYEMFGNIARERPIWLLPIAGRPLLDRVLGQLADFGIKSVDLFVSHHAMETYKYIATGDMISDQGDEKFLDRRLSAQKFGSCWGVEIKIIDVKNTYEGLRRLVYRELDEPILIGSATAMPPLARSLPERQPSGVVQEGREIRVSHPILFRDTTSTSKAASGSNAAWMIARPECFVGENCNSLAKLAATMETADEVETIEEQWSLSVNSVRAILRTQRLLLEEAIPGQPIEASHVEKGLWIGRNVDLHPSTRLIPPVYIGADCRIERGVVLGPNVMIENHCIVGERTSMTDSFVFPGTFVGHELSLDSAIAGPCFMQSLDAPQPLEGVDQFILGPNQRLIRPFLTIRLLARLAGVASLAVLAIPILMLWCLGLLCGIRRPIRVKESVQLPAHGLSNLWRTFSYREFWSLPRGRRGVRFFASVVRLLRARRWPALLNVVSGKVAWVGLCPRSVRNLASLPDDRRALCMRSKNGLVRLAEQDAARHENSSDDQEYASEIYYVATASPRFDLRLLWRAIWSR